MRKAKAAAIAKMTMAKPRTRTSANPASLGRSSLFRTSDSDSSKQATSTPPVDVDLSVLPSEYPPSFKPVELLKSPDRLKRAPSRPLKTSKMQASAERLYLKPPHKKVVERCEKYGVHLEKDVVFCNRAMHTLRINKSYRSLIERHWKQYAFYVERQDKKIYALERIVEPIIDNGGKFWLWEREQWDADEEPKFLDHKVEDDQDTILATVQQSLRDKKKAFLSDISKKKRKAEMLAKRPSSFSKKQKTTEAKETPTRDDTPALSPPALGVRVSDGSVSVGGSSGSQGSTTSKNASCFPGNAQVNPSMLSAMNDMFWWQAMRNIYGLDWVLNQQACFNPRNLWLDGTGLPPNNPSYAWDSPSDRAKNLGFIAIDTDSITESEETTSVEGRSSPETIDLSSIDGEVSAASTVPELVPPSPVAAAGMGPMTGVDEDDLMAMSDFVSLPHRGCFSPYAHWDELSEFGAESMRDKMNRQLERATATGCMEYLLEAGSAAQDNFWTLTGVGDDRAVQSDLDDIDGMLIQSPPAVQETGQGRTVPQDGGHSDMVTAVDQVIQGFCQNNTAVSAVAATRGPTPVCISSMAQEIPLAYRNIGIGQGQANTDTFTF